MDEETLNSGLGMIGTSEWARWTPKTQRLMACFLIWKLQVSGQRVSNVAAYQNHHYLPRALIEYYLDIEFSHQYLKKKKK